MNEIELQAVIDCVATYSGRGVYLGSSLHMNAREIKLANMELEKRGAGWRIVAGHVESMQWVADHGV